MIFDTLSNLELYTGIVKGMKTVIEVMDRGDVYRQEPGDYTTPDPKVSYRITVSKAGASDSVYKMHRNMTVIEIVLSGRDLLSYAWRENKARTIARNEKDDVSLIDGDPIAVFQGEEGRFAVFFPGEPYKTGVSATGNADECRRIAFLLKD